jgi:hypothetical protein
MPTVIGVPELDVDGACRGVLAHVCQCLLAMRSNLTAQFDPSSGAFVITEPIALVGPWKVEVGVRRETVPDDVRIPFTFDASLPGARAP